MNAIRVKIVLIGLSALLIGSMFVLGCRASPALSQLEYENSLIDSLTEETESEKETPEPTPAPSPTVSYEDTAEESAETDEPVRAEVTIEPQQPSDVSDDEPADADIVSAEPLEAEESEAEWVEPQVVEEPVPQQRVEEEYEVVYEQPVVTASPTYTYTDLSATMWTTYGLNVRSGPSSKFNRIGSFELGDSVTVTGRCNETGWYRIDYNGVTAYVSDQYLTDIEPVAVSNTYVPVDSNNYDNTSNTVTNDTGEYIDLLFVCGQSNAAGLTDQVTGYAQARMESVACDANLIYSSFVPLDDCGRNITGVSDIGSYVSANNVPLYISNAVGSETSVAGTVLAYKPYALSSYGSGKTGMDSAIAYQWNKLTGRKVWITNVSFSGSAISSWVQGTTNYEVTAETMREVIQVVNNDPNYQVGRVRMFWLQGESDTYTDQSYYENCFKNMIDGLNSATNGALKTGIIIPRAMGGNSNPFDSTPAQAALKNVANSYGNVAVVSDLNLTWVDDNAVRNYFSAVYPAGITYPTHNGLPINVPTAYSDVYIHPHYTQVGHNENGFDAARNMYAVFG